MLWVVPFAIGGFLVLRQKPIREKVAQAFGPFLPVGPMGKDQIDAAAFAKAKQKLMTHEGRRRDVYRDTEGFLTVGIGHKVLPQDQLNLGDFVSDQRIDELFSRDIKAAFDAARSQALDLKKYNPDFIASLTSVNFQLGTGWRYKFSSTYNDLKRGSVRAAINKLENSLWARQTPVRVADFVQEIEKAYGVA